MSLGIKNSKLSFFIIFFLAILTIFYVYKTVSLPQIVYSDEGDYIWTGHVITNAIRQKNWPLFWQLTYPQFHYPFFQSWYLGFATLPFRYTVESCRLVSLFLLLPTTLLLWLLAKKLSRNNILPLMVCGLILTSPLTLYYFSNTMKEGLATFLSFLAIWFYFLAKERKKGFFFFLASLSSLILTLTKYNYGALVLSAFGLESLIWFLKDKGFRKKDFWLDNGLLYLPFLISFAVWLFYPTNRVSYLFPFPQGKDVFNLDQANLLGHLLFYPKALAFSYTFSWPAFVFLVFGFLISLKNFRNYKIRILAVFFLINFILAEEHIINNQARYIFTSVPAFFLLGSLGLTESWPKIKKLAKKIYKKQVSLGIAFPFLATGVFILAKDLITLPRIVTGAGSQNIQSPAFYEQDYQNLQMFDFNHSRWPRLSPPPNAEKIPDVMNFVLNNADLRKNIFLVGGFDEFNRGIFDFYLNKARESPDFQKDTLQNLRVQDNPYQEYFVVLQIKKSSRFDTLGYRYFTKLRGIDSAAAANQSLADKSLKRITEKYFPYLGLTAIILGR